MAFDVQVSEARIAELERSRYLRQIGELTAEVARLSAACEALHAELAKRETGEEGNG